MSNHSSSGYIFNVDRVTGERSEGNAFTGVIREFQHLNGQLLPISAPTPVRPLGEAEARAMVQQDRSRPVGGSFTAMTSEQAAFAEKQRQWSERQVQSRLIINGVRAG